MTALLFVGITDLTYILVLKKYRHFGLHLIGFILDPFEAFVRLAFFVLQNNLKQV